MSEEPINEILKGFGLTETEMEVYIFLARRGLLKCSDISRQMKKDRAQSLRILKSLIAKGIVEATLESPTRYAPVPFEQIIDLSIKAKRDEAALIENTKKDLLNYWNKTGKTSTSPLIEKFTVIEGNQKIYSKIIQMIKETQNQLSCIAAVPDLLQSERYGVYEAMLNHPLKSDVNFRFITDASAQNLSHLKYILEKQLKSGINLKGRNPELGMRLFPRMVIRDNYEIIFFINPKTATEVSTDHCLWTNCSNLVQAFAGVFENLWQNSTDIYVKISEIEIDTQDQPKTCIIPDAEVTAKKFCDFLYSAKKEVIMVTSSTDLAELCRKKQILKEWSRRNVLVKVMVPVTSDNLEIVQELSEQCEVRHVSFDYLATTLVDGKHLFQTKTPSLQEVHRSQNFDDTFYSNDFDHIMKTRNMLDNIWKEAKAPSSVTLATVIAKSSKLEETLVGPVRKVSGPIIIKEREFERLTEEDILRKIIFSQQNINPVSLKGGTEQYGFSGQAIIHPPKSTHLPDLLFYIQHYEKQSSYGASDSLLIHLWIETPQGYAFVLVTFAHDNPEASPMYEKLFGRNVAIQLLKKDEVQIQLHGNTFFCGWTAPISLGPNYVLEPSSILLEGSGKLKTGRVSYTTPTDYNIIQEFNGLEAFVTFYHPASKYSGPGTDGFIVRDLITTIFPV